VRIVKKPEERRDEILDAADELFGQKGFDGTSTNDILEKVGIARGTLYYHFKSKEDIMDGLIGRYNTRLMHAAQEVAADKSIPVVARIIRTVTSMNVSSGGGEEIMEHIHKPQNALMHAKIQKMIVSGLTPILADLVREGIDEGLFHTPFPYECMEMVVIYANTVFDDEAGLTEEELATRIPALVHNIERLMGAEEGSLVSAMQIFGGGGGGHE
jgi:AcrR family transcriptional regulator